MQLTIKLKKRWITSVLAEAEKTSPPMPWQRAKGRKPVPATPGLAHPRLVRVEARAN